MELNKDTINRLNNTSLRKFKRDYEFLGEGIARMVFSLNDKFVVKVAKNQDGYHQNFVERFVYSNCPAKIKKYLCPIIYSNSRIIIMAKAVPYNKILRKHAIINPENLREEDSVLEDLDYLVNEFHLYEKDIFSSRSWGIINGNFYIIDFGCTSDYGDMFYDNLKSIYYQNTFPNQ